MKYLFANRDKFLDFVAMLNTPLLSKRLQPVLLIPDIIFQLINKLPARNALHSDLFGNISDKPVLVIF